MNPTIIVNATALDRSGALSILKQFIENIPSNDFNWLIFSPDGVLLESCNSNVRVEHVKNVKSLHKRLLWDSFGIKKWLKTHNIEPIAAVSLQNTGFIVGKSVPSFIYYHQPIPFYPFNWNPLKKRERTFWFYKYLYPFAVKLFLNKDTKVFVQLDFIKKGFAKRFNHRNDLINVYSPSIIEPKIQPYKKQYSNKIQLIYPAMPHFYKNHRVIVDALESIDKDLTIIFTIDPSKYSYKDNRILAIGMQSYDNLNALYNASDALLFPSYIETFGLPLIEAAMMGMPILAADLPYAREVLDGYEGVKFIKYGDHEAWAQAIDHLEKGKRYKPLDISARPGWSELFKNIISSIKICQSSKTKPS